MKPSPPTLPPPPRSQHLDIGHIRTDVGRRSVRSGVTRLLEQGAVFVMSIGSTAALARLLTPEDFGLMAMVAIPLALIFNLRHFGLPMALVHREHVTPAAADALYWATVTLSAAACLLMAGSGPLLAALFDEPVVTALTVAAAGALFVKALGAPHEGLLMRQMRFGMLTATRIAATFVGMVAGIVAAFSGAGAWALVLQMAVTNGLETVFWWVGARWWPKLRPRTWRHSGLGTLIAYGLPYAGFSVTETIGRNADRVAIGYVTGASALGLYDNAFRWARFPLQQVFTPLLGVAVSGLSRVKREPKVFRAYVQRSVQPVLGLALPALAFVVVAAEPVVRVLLGDQWLDAIPLLRWLAAAAFVRCFVMVARWLFLAEGRTRSQLRWGFVVAPTLIVAAVIGVQWGAYGVAVASFVASIALAVPETAIALRESAVRPRDLLAAQWRPTVAAVVAAAAVQAIADSLPGSPVPGLLSSGGLYTLGYVTTWILLPGGVQAAREGLTMLRRAVRAGGGAGGSGGGDGGGDGGAGTGVAGTGGAGACTGA